MFERLTDKARAAVVGAQEVARQHNHDYIGTEHLLLGLMQLKDSLSQEALLTAGYTTEMLDTGLSHIVQNGTVAPTGHLAFTSRAKKVLELALREGLQLGHNHVADFHLLLGIIRLGEGTAVTMLERNQGSNALETLRHVIMTMSADTAGGPPVPSEQVLITNQLRGAILERVARMSDVNELRSLLSTLPE